MATPSVMQVKNTFIDIPGSHGTPLPSPLASAPARSAAFVQESLLTASNLEEHARGPLGAVKRSKPNPLNFLSQNSMGSILESPAAGATAARALVQAVVPSKDPMAYISGLSVGPEEVPKTPVVNWGVSETPLNLGWSKYSLATPTAGALGPKLATPTFRSYRLISPAQSQASSGAPSRTTLSLVQMIQSPKVEDKVALLSSAYHQAYQVPSAIPSGYQYAAPLMPQPQLPHGHELGPNPVVQLPPMQPPSPPPSSAPSTVSAATVLGLVAGSAPRSPPMVASLGFGQPTSPQSPPPFAPAPNAFPAVAVSSHPHPPIAAAPIQYAPATVYSQQAYPVPMASQVMMPPPAHLPPTYMPPPPLAPAPMVVVSPKATQGLISPPSASFESDIKTLLQIAVASGNQEAMNAVMRQAQQSGMSESHFRSLLPAPMTTA